MSLEEAIAKARAASIAKRKALLVGWSKEEALLAEKVRQAIEATAGEWTPCGGMLDHPDNLVFAKAAIAAGASADQTAAAVAWWAGTKRARISGWDIRYFR